MELDKFLPGLTAMNMCITCVVADLKVTGAKPGLGHVLPVLQLRCSAATVFMSCYVFFCQFFLGISIKNIVFLIDSNVKGL